MQNAFMCSINMQNAFMCSINMQNAFMCSISTILNHNSKWQARSQYGTEGVVRPPSVAFRRAKRQRQLGSITRSYRTLHIVLYTAPAGSPDYDGEWLTRLGVVGSYKPSELEDVVNDLGSVPNMYFLKPEKVYN